MIVLPSFAHRAAARAAVAALLASPVAASALPLLGRDTGQDCAACHAGSSATDKIGAFVAGLSVNRTGTRPAPAYVPLAALLSEGAAAPAGGYGREYVFWRQSAADGYRTPEGGVYRSSYGGSLGVYNRSGYDGRMLTLEGFWLPRQYWRIGAQFTLSNRVDAGDVGGDPAWRRDPGTLFLYLQRSY